MKFTGITVMLIGTMILIFGGFMSMQTAPAATDTSNQSSIVPILLIVFGLVALLGGGLITAFGGRGYIRSNNLAVRN